MTTLVIGLGQQLGGDDGVGLAVLDELERRGVQGVSLRRARDASCLLELLPSEQAVIVVDAVLVEPESVGRVLVLQPSELDPSAHAGVSSHGVSVAQALELCRTLHAEPIAPELRLVAIGIRAPDGYAQALSPRVRQGVQAAARRIERMLGANYA